MNFITPESSEWASKSLYELSKITYMEGLLCHTIPSSSIKHVMRLEFEYQDKKSYLNNIKVGGFNELIINTIDIGMLTPNRD
jgi:hypothetical protein